jgi:hypothetical protein
MTHEEKIEWMTQWAEKQGGVLVLNREIRTFLGKLPYAYIASKGDKAVEYHWGSEDDGDLRDDNSNEEISAPVGSYETVNGSPLLAMLGSGKIVEDRFYRWLKHLDDSGFRLFPALGGKYLALAKTKDRVPM